MTNSMFEVVLIFLVPQIVSLISVECALTDAEAAERLYVSDLYRTLEDEETKLWHLSARALLELLKEEWTMGTITYPEEA